MDNLSQLESLTAELALASKGLANYCRNVNVDLRADPWLGPAGREAHGVRQGVLASLYKVQMLLEGPIDLLQRLATQVCLPSRSTWVLVY